MATWRLLLLLLASAPALAQEAVSKEPLGPRIDEVIRRQTKGDFWGVVLVAREGEVLFAKGYGSADYERKPNTPETIFELASLSKQFTAAAILKLEQQGRLKTTDTLDKFFRGVPADKKGVTVHHLLTHTSGLSPHFGVPYASRIGREDYVKQALARPLDAPPGEKYAYCNSAYALLAAIVEIASKRSFEEYVRDEIFAPAGLADTGFIGDEALAETGRAARRRAAPRDWSAVDWYWGWGYRGMGGVVSTAPDLLAWDRALRGDAVLGAAAKEKLFTPVQADYACGWVVQTTGRGTTKVFHGGLVMGFGAHFARYLEDDVVVAILSNDRRDLGELEEAISALVFPAPRIGAVVDATPYRLNRYRAAEVAGPLAWTVEKRERLVTMTLRDGDHVTVEIRCAPEAVRGFAPALERAIAVRAKDDPGGEAAVEAGLYLLRYPAGQTRLTIDDGVELLFHDEYRGQGPDGREIVDRRPILIVKDAGSGDWPAIVRMNVAAARALLEALRKAAG